MTEKLILEDLNAGKLENFDRFISEYLSPAQKTSTCSSDQLSRYTLTTVQVLQASVTHISTSGPLRQVLLNAIHTCYSFYAKNRDLLKLPDPLTLPKVLYHIVAKLADVKDCANDVYKTCQYLYDELLPLADHSTGATASIITNTYSKLWNVAIKLEQDKATQQPDLVLQLRHMAIKMLLLRRIAVAQTVDKFLLAIDRYDKSTIQRNMKTPLSADHLSVTLVLDIVQCIETIGSGDGTLTEKDVCSSLSLFQYLHQLIMTHQLHAILGMLHQKSKTFLHTFTNVAFCSVIKNLYETFYLSMKCTKSEYSKTGLSDIKCLSENITELLQKSLSGLNTGWCVLICECLLVILKTTVSSESQCLAEGVLEYAQKVTQFLIRSRDDGKLLYEEDSVEKNNKLAELISTKLIVILRSELELGITLMNSYNDPARVTHHLWSLQLLTKTYVQQIEQTQHMPPAVDVVLRERRQCGYLMSKFAKLSCSLGCQDLDVFYYSVECDQLTKWAESDESLKQQRIKEVNLLGIYEMLVDIHWKLGDIDAVLTTLTRSVQLDHTHLAAAVELWCRIKREQLRVGNAQIANRCFVDSMKEVSGTQNDYDVLKMEWKTFTQTRKKYPEAELSLLRRLQLCASLPVQKAECLLEIAKLLWGHSSDKQERSVEECLQEAVQCLENVVTSEEAMILADVQLWTYIVKHENICKQLISSSQKMNKMEESVSYPGEEAQTCSSFVFDVMCMFSMEMEIIRHLDQAVELWEKVSASFHTQESLRSLVLCSSILRLTGKTDREQRVLFLANRVCNELRDDAVCNVIKCRLSHLYSAHGHHVLATELLPSVPDQQSGFDDGYLQTVMASVMHFLHTRQIQKGLELLYNINEKIGQQPSHSKTVCLANGTMKRYWSMFLSLPTAPPQGDGVEEYSLDHAIEAYRNHVSVVYFLLGKDHWTLDNKGMKTTEKFDVIQEYLLSLFHLGQLERLVGDMRSAKFHIKEGWTTAHFMGLPKWALMFMNEFSTIHILSENVEAATSSLTKTCQVFNGSQSPAGKTSKDSKSKKSKALEAFGFDEEEKIEGDSGKFQCSYPPCWQHLINNVTCDLCEDDSVKLAVLSYSLVTAKFDVYLQQNHRLKTLDKIHTVCQRYINLKAKTVREDQMEPLRCVFQDDSHLKDIYVECLSLMAESSLQLGNTDKCASVIQTAQEFFQTQHVNDLAANLIQNKFTVFKAQMCLMRSLTSKMDPCDQEADIVDNITPLETSIKPEEMASVISNNPEDADPLTLADVDCSSLVEDIEKLDINDREDRNANSTQTGIGKNKGRRGARKKQTEEEISGGLSETSCVKEEAEKVESKATKKSAAGTRRKNSTKSVQPCTNKSVHPSTGRRQGNTDGSLTEEPTNTPTSSAPDFVLKTPYSVSSRKALMFSSDSSDEDSSASLAVSKRGTGPSVTTANPDSCANLAVSKRGMGSSVTTANPDSCSSTNSTPTTTKTKSKSRIPKYGKRTRVSEAQKDSCLDTVKQVRVQNSSVAQDLPVSRVKKTAKQNVGLQENKENVSVKKTIPRRGKAITSQEPATTYKAEPVKTTSRGRKKAVETVVQKDCSDSKDKCQAKDDVYDFDGGDITEPMDANTKAKKTTRKMNTRVKRQPAEKVRSAEVVDSGVEQADLMRQIGYYTVEEETSLSSEEDQPRVHDIHISKPDLTDNHHSEENYSILREEVLDDSIEIPRGGNEKKTGRGKSRKVTKPSKPDSPGEEPPGGTDTREIPRSTTQANMQLTMERMRRAVPQQKLSKDAAGKAGSPKDEDLTSMLETAFEQARHLPTTGLYSSICNLLALQYVTRCPLKAAYYLTEGMVVTFRHQSLVNCSRKIRKCKKETSSEAQGGTQEKGGAQEGEIKNTIYKNLMFNKTPQDLQKIIKELPEDWTLCQVSMVTNPQVPDEMVLSSMRKDQDPVIVRLGAFKTVQGRRILSEFSDIMEQSHNSIKITDKTEWWQNRWTLDDRLKDVLRHIDKYWLGPWRCLIQGTVSGADLGVSPGDLTSSVCEEIYRETKVRLPVHVLQRFVENAESLSDEDLLSAILELTGNERANSGVDNCVAVFRKWTTDLKPVSRRGHVLLVLDKSVQHLPWECVPSLANTSISRMPSLYHLHSQLSYLKSQKSSILHTGIDKQKVFYVLNPDSNLASTQETFQDWFSGETSWEGIINRKPTKAEYTHALQNKDLFLYCGHGTGGAYLGGSDLASLDCRAATILMGCSSGKLEAAGHLEASGFMLNYFMAGCPCMVANLWDVTDKDIDRFLACLLSSWLSEETSAHPRTLLDVIPKARAACRLPHLIGAAPVVYGFPVFLKPS